MLCVVLRLIDTYSLFETKLNRKFEKNEKSIL